MTNEELTRLLNTFEENLKTGRSQSNEYRSQIIEQRAIAEALPNFNTELTPAPLKLVFSKHRKI